MKRTVALAILVMASWFHAQPLSRPVRVRLFSIEQPSRIQLKDADGQTVQLDAHHPGPPYRGAGPVTVSRPNAEAIRIPFPLEVTAGNGALLIVAEIPLEDYVAAVLAGESSGFRSEESLKAMAVAARTYATHFLGRHESDGFDFCDATHCQDSRITAVNDRLRKAVNDTRGEIIQYGGQTIPAYYHQDCGGIPEAQAPYFRQWRDVFCVSGGRMRWSAVLEARDIQKALGVKDVSGIEIVERTSAGRAQRIRVDASERREMDAETFRAAVGRAHGWNRIRSDLYEVGRSGDRFVFEGYGAGHGMGMCQNGAAAMGEQGYMYKDILGYYYPNTTVVLHHD